MSFGLARSLSASLVAAALAGVSAAACMGARTPTPVPSAKPPGAASTSSLDGLGREGDFAPRITSAAVWDALAFKPATSPLPGTEVVKTVFDRTTGALYFLQSERWPIHYFFARRFLSTAEHPVPDEGAFNRREYHLPDRRFVLGTVSRYPGGVWAFELYASDGLSLDETARMFALVRDRVFFSKELRYRPVPHAHEVDPRTARLMPIVTTGELFGHITYQPLELGDAYGFLRVFRRGATLDPSKLRPFDVVVLASLPEDLPVVAGVVSDEVQAPLGHINLLCHDRRTPNMHARGASERPDVRALEGKLVRLSVGATGFELREATQAEAEASWAAKRPKTVTRPERDDADVGLPMLDALSVADLPRVGAKAARLGPVARLAGDAFRVPVGFVVPMAGYRKFLRTNGLDARLDALLRDEAFARDPAVREERLASLRGAIERATVPDELLDAVVARMRAVMPPGKVRLRSSTNAEDLPGFNGAGLYRSARVDPTDRADVARGLRAVWASVWLWPAHEERTYYRIDSSTVGMAILVQESIDDDVVNGVAVTANPFSQGQPGFFVNAQLSGGSVTGARGDEVPEQVLLYDYEGGEGIERLSLSSRAGGVPILGTRDLERLRAALRRIHDAVTSDPSGLSGRAVDVEFLLSGAGREVCIVQARPFDAAWTKERRWLDDDGRARAPGPR